MPCSEGRLPALYFPVFNNCSMLRLYGRSTRRLSAFGLSTGDIHHIRVKASFTRMRSTFTQTVGDGSLAGLYQTNSSQRCNSAASRNLRRARITVVDIVGFPGTQALPISRTIDPVGKIKRRKSLA